MFLNADKFKSTFTSLDGVVERDRRDFLSLGLLGGDDERDEDDILLTCATWSFSGLLEDVLKKKCKIIRD